MCVADTGDVYSWGDNESGVSGHSDTQGQKSSCVVWCACACAWPALLYSQSSPSLPSPCCRKAGHQYLPLQVSALDGKRAIQVAACGFHTAALLGERQRAAVCTAQHSCVLCKLYTLSVLFGVSRHWGTLFLGRGQVWALGARRREEPQHSHKDSFACFSPHLTSCLRWLPLGRCSRCVPRCSH